MYPGSNSLTRVHFFLVFIVFLVGMLSLSDVVCVCEEYFSLEVTNLLL